MTASETDPSAGVVMSVQGFQQATRAYAVSSNRRSRREQEAEVFRLVNAALRRGRESGGAVLVRALADTMRLWNMVLDLVGDPDNTLPADLRASIISVGLAVRRETQRPQPDVDFLVSINENIASGLSGTA